MPSCWDGLRVWCESLTLGLWSPFAVRQLWQEQRRSQSATGGQSSVCAADPGLEPQQGPRRVFLHQAGTSLQGKYNDELTEAVLENLLLDCLRECGCFSLSAFPQKVGLELKIHQQEWL